VDDLAQAVSYLGFNRIRDLAVTASVSDLFRSSRPVGTYQRSELWRHMVAVAVCSRMIAVRTKVEEFVNAFLAGLLHDLGIILSDQSCHEEFRRVILSLNSSTTLPEVERRLLGWDHTELGFLVGSKWKLPSVVLSSIRFHHEPEKYSGAGARVVHSVAVANLICSLKNMTSVGRNLIRLSPESLQVLKLNKTDLKILAEDLDREVALNKHLFEIQQGR
jgi:HD-like signal output (HDOD) protein